MMIFNRDQIIKYVKSYTGNDIIQFRERGQNIGGITYCYIPSDYPRVQIEKGGKHDTSIDITLLPEGDYEIYDSVQICKSGYLEIVDGRKCTRNILTALYNAVKATREFRKDLLICQAGGETRDSYGDIQDQFIFYYGFLEVHVEELGYFNVRNHNRMHMHHTGMKFNEKYNNPQKFLKLYILIDVYKDYWRGYNNITREILNSIGYILANVPGLEFHDDYIRRWLY